MIILELKIFRTIFRWFRFKMFHCNTYIHQYLCVLIKYPFELLISLSTRKPFVTDKEIKPKIGFERLI